MKQYNFGLLIVLFMRFPDYQPGSSNLTKRDLVLKTTTTTKTLSKMRLTIKWVERVAIRPGTVGGS